jgi:hypothetical protein
MKTSDKNSVKSQIINFRIAEIHEAIAQIKIHISEIERSREINPIRYVVGAEMMDVKIHLERFEWHINDLSNLFE